MSDKELLMLAAKAAQYDVDFEGWGPLWYALGYDKNGDVEQWWNPLTGDACALRMAVKLGFCISQWTDTTEFLDTTQPPHVMVGYKINETKGGNIVENYGDDPYAATRRAIVIAAAEIGKAMA